MKPTTAFYNPHLLSREELIAGFIARQPLLELLLDDLRRGGGQHHLLVGARGTGKTTLLLRLAVAIDDDAKLAKQMIALRFPEEQYNVARPSDLWLNCVDALVDALEQRQDLREARRLDEEISKLDGVREEAERAEKALGLLTKWTKRTKKTVVLLIDNLDIVLDRLAEEHWTLRKTLGAHQGLILIGASSSFIQESFEYGSAFYEFFNVHELGTFDDDEVRRLLLHLAKATNTPQVARAIEDHPGRLKALLLLSGGTPRTIGLLHGVLASESTASAEEDLEVILDLVTPYYKARFDDLPAQSQLIVDAVALNWNPITAAECADRTRLDVSLVSAQLSRLVRQGVVTKVDADTDRTAFQIAERFFNIWYLMRSSRRLRRKLFWLVTFVQSWYGQEEIDRRAADMLATEKISAQEPERLLAFASAVTDTAIRRRLEFRAVESLVSKPQRGGALHEVLDLDGEDRHLGPVVDRTKTLAKVRHTILTSKGAWPKETSAATVADELCAEILLPLSDKVGLAEELARDTAAGRQAALAVLPNLRRSASINERLEPLRSAVGRGEVPSLWDVRTVQDLDAMAAYVDRSGGPYVYVALGLGSVQLFDDLSLFDRLVIKLDGMPFIMISVIGRRLDELEWTTARRYVEHVLRNPGPEPEILATARSWRDFVRHERAGDVADLLDVTGWRERALPLYEALRSIAGGRGTSLARLAPEVRTPAETIRRELLAPPKQRKIEAPASPAPAATKKRGRPQASGRRKPV